MKKSSFFIFVYLWFSLGIIAQTTSIPDPNFEQTLIELSYDDVLDGEVLTDNISDVSSLSIANSNISDLSGINDFVALEVLNCSENNLTTLDLTGLLYLEDLFCMENELDSLSLMANPFIKRLSCVGNRLSYLNVYGCSELNELYCSDNRLTTLNLEGTNLLKMYVDNNDLGTLDLSYSLNLQYVIISHNPLTTIDFSGIDSLQSVVCSETLITELDLSDKTKLYGITAENNPHLNFLDLRGIENTTFFPPAIHLQNNELLHCIQIDNPGWATEELLACDEHATFSRDCVLGMKKEEEKRITIYPNPAVDKLYIRLETNSAVANVYDMKGELIKNMPLNTGVNVIDLMEVVKGVYLLKIEGEERNEIEKIVVR